MKQVLILVLAFIFILTTLNQASAYINIVSPTPSQNLTLGDIPIIIETDLVTLDSVECIYGKEGIANKTFGSTKLSVVNGVLSYTLNINENIQYYNDYFLHCTFNRNSAYSFMIYPVSIYWTTSQAQSTSSLSLMSSQIYEPQIISQDIVVYNNINFDCSQKNNCMTAYKKAVKEYLKLN